MAKYRTKKEALIGEGAEPEILYGRGEDSDEFLYNSDVLRCDKCKHYTDDYAYNGGIDLIVDGKLEGAIIICTECCRKHVVLEEHLTGRNPVA